MQITPEQIIFLLMVILSSQYRQAGAFRRSTAMCSSKRISCLSETSYRFCFQAGSTTYSYGRIKHCPYGTECDDVKGKYACVKEEKHVSEFQSTPTGYPNLWVTEIQESSENNDISTIPIITVFPTIVPTTVPWTSSATSNPFVSLMGNHKTMFTTKNPELETTTSNYTEENTLEGTSSPLTSTPVPELNETTTKKIKRKKNPSKPKKRKKPTKLVVEPKTTTVLPPSYHPSTTPLQKYSSTATTIYPSSKKPPKKRRKKPQKTPTQIPPTGTKKPPEKLKKKKKTSTTSSVTQTTSASTTYLLPMVYATSKTNSTTTIAELSPVEPARLSPTATMSSSLSIPPVTTFSEVSPTSESPRISSPSTTSLSLAAPSPCPYYLNILYSRSASTTTQTAVSLTPPSSCKTAGKYPSKNCHEYFECLKVMWWYRLMIMKCKKGEGFDATLLQCIPDETCV